MCIKERYNSHDLTWVQYRIVQQQGVLGRACAAGTNSYEPSLLADTKDDVDKDSVKKSDL